MTTAIPSWPARAISRIQGLLGDHAAPWARGTWVSARERYDEIPLPSDFSVDVVVLDGVRRRLARRAGTGRPLLILPGLYASLNERLFVTVAALAAAQDRPVVLLEDRLAAPTVGLAGTGTLDPAAAGGAVTALARLLDAPPDVLALSAGLVGAWSAHGEALHRVVGFSGIRDPAAAARQTRTRPLVYRHFAACHAHSGLDLTFDALLDRLLSVEPIDPPDTPWLLVHAIDDPVVPIASLDDLDPTHVCRLHGGGHMGFGVMAGPGIYLVPFGDDADG